MSECVMHHGHHGGRGGASAGVHYDVPHSHTPYSLSNLTYQSQALPEYII